MDMGAGKPMVTQAETVMALAGTSGTNSTRPRSSLARMPTRNGKSPVSPDQVVFLVENGRSIRPTGNGWDHSVFDVAGEGFGAGIWYFTKKGNGAPYYHDPDFSWRGVERRTPQEFWMVDHEP